MLVYFICFLTICALGYLSIFNPILDSLGLLLATVILVLLTGFRYYSDADYYAYLEIYSEIPSLFNLTFDSLRQIPFEWGFTFACSIFRLFFDDAYVFLFIFSMVSIYLKVQFFKKNTYHHLLAFLLYFSFVFFNSEFIQIRWALAVGIVSLAVTYLQANNRLLCFISLFVATSVHIASVIPVFAIIIFLLLRTFKARYYFFLCLLSMVIGTIFSTIEIIDFIPDIPQLAYFQLKLDGYQNSDNEVSIVPLLYSAIIFSMASFLVYLGDSSNYKSKRDDIKTTIYPIYCIVLSISFLSLSIPIFFGRIYIIAHLLASTIIAQSLTNVHNNLLRKTVIVILFCEASFISLYMINFHFLRGNISEYKTFFVNVF